MINRPRSRRISTSLVGLVLVAAAVGAGGVHPERRAPAADLSPAGLAAGTGRAAGTAAGAAAARSAEEEAQVVRSSSPPIVPVDEQDAALLPGPADLPPDPTDAAAATSASGSSTTARPPVTSVPVGAGAGFATQDLPGWSLLFAQDFDRDAPLGQFASVYRGWAGYDGGRDTSASYGRAAVSQGQYRSDSTTSVHDGVVDQFLHTAGTTPQVVALTPTPDGSWWSGQTYGRYAVRFRADAVPGYKLAFLLWPSSDDWSQGEIDFPEGALGDSIAAFSHDVTGDPSSNAFHVDTGVSTDGWHTAVIEWSPGQLTYWLDSRSWTTTDPAAIPTDPMRWVLQTETELSSDAPDPGVSGHVLIDWVAAWRLA